MIDQVLKLYPDALITEDLSSKLPFHAPGLSTYADQIFHPALQNTLRLWPHLTGMSGFFCTFTKTGVIPITPQAPPTSTFLAPSLKRHRSIFSRQFVNRFGMLMDLTLAKSSPGITSSF